MTKDEAMKLALEALESAVRYHGIMLMSDPPQDAWKYHRVENKADQAITALREALAHPEQEPVAIALNTGTKQGVKWLKNVDHGKSLYTTPPQRTWVSLTDEEREEIALEVPMDAVCITEAKLKEKNNA